MSKYDKTMMAVAFLWAEHATCDRLSVGCVISRDERILVQGYNGAPKGMPHCPPLHEPERCLAVHAEQNTIAWAARTGISLLNSTAYSTHQPCLICARLLITAGITRVVYSEPYRLIDGLELLEVAGIDTYRFEWESNS